MQAAELSRTAENFSNAVMPISYANRAGY
jgi:hypothetical protein